MKPSLYIAAICLLLLSCNKEQLITKLSASNNIDNSVVGNSGIVYIMRGGNGDGIPAAILALDINTGFVKWQHTDSINTVFSPIPCVANNTLFTLSHSSASDPLRSKTTLTAFDAHTGRLHWKKLLFNDYLNLSNPTFENNTVYAAVGNKLFAVNAENGNTIWKKVFDGLSDNLCSPTVVNGTIYIGNRLHLFSLNAVNGSVNWTVNGNLQSSSPTVANGLISFIDNTSFGNVKAFDTSGNFKWEKQGKVYGSTTVSNHIIYECEDPYPKKDIHCYGLKESNSSIGWEYSEQNILKQTIAGDGDLFYADNTLYFKLTDSVIAINTSAINEKRWSFFTGHPTDTYGILSSTIEGRGVVYTESGNNILFALNASDGSVIWRTNIGGENTYYSPVVLYDDGTTVHPTGSGMTQ
jgi:outer membrane protein assembly factor BamB